MAGWRRLGWSCAVVLIYAEYVSLSVVKGVLAPLPAFLTGLEILVFPAVVLAMPGAGAFVAALVYNVARRRPITFADLAAAAICIVLTVLILRW